MEITEKEYLRLLAEGRRWYEIYSGELTPSTENGLLHGIVAGNILTILYRFVRENQPGYILNGLPCILRKEGNTVIDARIPDLCFVKHLPEDIERPFYGVPDLAIEVLAPDERAERLRTKIVDYLSLETEQVWIAYPTHREIHVYTGSRGGNVCIYIAKEVLEAEMLFPGLKISIADCFLDEFEE